MADGSKRGLRHDLAVPATLAVGWFVVTLVQSVASELLYSTMPDELSCYHAIAEQGDYYYFCLLMAVAIGVPFHVLTAPGAFVVSRAGLALGNGPLSAEWLLALSINSLIWSFGLYVGARVAAALWRKRRNEVDQWHRGQEA